MREGSDDQTWSLRERKKAVVNGMFREKNLLDEEGKRGNYCGNTQLCPQGSKYNRIPADKEKMGKTT